MENSNDALIIQAVDIFNDAHGYSSGDSGYLTPELVKAWMMEESGSISTKSAFLRDPLQVNNAGDWDPKKSILLGLTEGQSMDRKTSVNAALGGWKTKDQITTSTAISRLIAVIAMPSLITTAIPRFTLKTAACNTGMFMPTRFKTTQHKCPSRRRFR